MKLKAVFFDKLWLPRGHPAGFLLLPADGGGQEVSVRVGSLTATVIVQVFRQ